MRFKQFLLSESQNFSFEEGLQRIVADCKPFLHQSHGNPMYRGINSPNIEHEEVFFTHHPNNRSPKDSEPRFNFMFNALIDAAFDIQNVRRTSWFASGNWRQAKTYGQTHFVFPKGKFEFLWSPLINDSYEDETIILTHLEKEMHYEVTPPLLRKIFDEIMSEEKDPHVWIHDLNGRSEEQTKEAFQSVLDPEVYSRFWSANDAYAEMTRAMMKTGSELYKSNNLAEALTEAGSGRGEIFITSSDGYYAIPVYVVKQEMQRETGEPTGHLEFHEYYDWLLSHLSGASENLASS
jgi:hypothetical protein